LLALFPHLFGKLNILVSVWKIHFIQTRPKILGTESRHNDCQSY